MKISTGVILIVAGFMVGFGVSYLNFNHQVAALKVQSIHADSIATSRDRALAERVRISNDSLARITAVRKIDQARTRIAQDSADALARTLDRAKTATDSVPILVAEVRNLRNANAGLVLDSISAAAATTVWQNRALTAEADVRDLTGQIHNLNTKIQGLHAPPTLALKILRGASYVATAIAAYKVGEAVERKRS